jgi:hypothetical protein
MQKDDTWWLKSCPIRLDDYADGIRLVGSLKPEICKQPQIINIDGSVAV